MVKNTKPRVLFNIHLLTDDEKKKREEELNGLVILYGKITKSRSAINL